MVVLLGSVFYLTFHIVGPCLSQMLARVIAWLADAADGALLALDAKPLLRALVREGVFAGVGERGGVSAGDPGAVFSFSLCWRTQAISRVWPS